MRSLTVRTVVRGALVAAVVAAGVAGVAIPAYAAPGDTSTGTTQANVTVSGAITLTSLSPSLQLTGIPGDTPTDTVSMVVTTNNLAGYTVSVEAGAAVLTPTAVGNTDTIPISSLQVQGSGTGAAFQALTSGTPTVVYTKPGPSAGAGDTLVNTYRMTIPFVEPDTYEATLTYVATTL